MKITERIIIIILSELKILYKNLKKEVNYIFSLSFLKYLKNLIFPPDYGYTLIFFRLVTLYFILRFVYDVLIFILKTLFNFYFIILDRIFEIIFRLNFLFFEGWIFFSFNLKIIRFFRYLFLFMFFVNIAQELKRKRIPLWVYIVEGIADGLITFIRKPIKFRNILYPILKILEIIVLLLHILFLLPATFIDIFLFPIYRFFRTVIFIRLLAWYRWFRVVRRFNKADRYHLNNTFLFHISTSLQANGFIAPECQDPKIWIKAKLDYRRYRRKYRRAELTPDKVDNGALNIYIYLRSLLEGTRYQRKVISMFDVVIVMFPYNYIIHAWFWVFYFFVGLMYVVYFLFLPLFCFYVGIRILYIIYDFYEYFYFLGYGKNFDSYIIRKKENEIFNKRIRKRYDKFLLSFTQKLKKIYLLFKKINIFFKNKFNWIYSYLKNVVKTVVQFFKKVYEKIFR